MLTAFLQSHQISKTYILKQFNKTQMTDVTSILNGIQELFTSSSGTDFLVWLVLVPIAIIVIVTLLLMKFWDNQPKFTEQLWFKIVYVVGLYIVSVAIVSLIFGFIK